MHLEHIEMSRRHQTCKEGRGDPGLSRKAEVFRAEEVELGLEARDGGRVQQTPTTANTDNSKHRQQQKPIAATTEEEEEEKDEKSPFCPALLVTQYITVPLYILYLYP